MILFQSVISRFYTEDELVAHSTKRVKLVYTGKNESLSRIVKNMDFLWKNFGILVEYRFSKESITLQRISNVWNYCNFGKFQEFCWSLTLEYLWNFYGNI